MYWVNYRVIYFHFYCLVVNCIFFLIPNFELMINVGQLCGTFYGRKSKYRMNEDFRVGGKILFPSACIMLLLLDIFPQFLLVKLSLLLCTLISKGIKLPCYILSEITFCCSSCEGFFLSEWMWLNFGFLLPPEKSIFFSNTKDKIVQIHEECAAILIFISSVNVDK